MKCSVVCHSVRTNQKVRPCSVFSSRFIGLTIPFSVNPPLELERWLSGMKMLQVTRRRPSLLLARLGICIKLNFAQLCRIDRLTHYPSVTAAPPPEVGNHQFRLKTNDLRTLWDITSPPVLVRVPCDKGVHMLSVFLFKKLSNQPYGSSRAEQNALRRPF